MGLISEIYNQERMVYTLGAFFGTMFGGDFLRVLFLGQYFLGDLSYTFQSYVFYISIIFESG